MRWIPVSEFVVALRSLVRQPSFFVASILLLGAGIGTVTAVYSLLAATVFSPLPYPESDRLVMIYEANVAQGIDTFNVDAQNFPYWRDEATSFESMVLFDGDAMTLGEGESRERLQGVQVSPNVLDVLGVKPFIGTGFANEHGIVGKDRVVLLSYGLWQRAFQGDSEIVGKTIRMDGELHLVTGVMPEGFRFPIRFYGLDVQYWRPLPMQRAVDRNSGKSFLVAGRLREGVGVNKAQDEMARIAANLSERFPLANKGWTANVVSMHEDLYPIDSRRPAYLLAAALLLLLALSVANVAILLLARNERRAREFALRRALGAGRIQVLRVLLAECAWITLAGGTLGLLVGAAASRVFSSGLLQSLPRVESATFGVEATIFAFALAAATAFGFGAIPAALMLHGGPNDPLRTRASAGDSVASRLSMRGLLAAEVAIALVLLCGSLLLLASVRNLLQVDPGFRTENLNLTWVGLPDTSYPDPPSRLAYFERLRREVESMPGVLRVAYGNNVPFVGSWNRRIAVEGEPLTSEVEREPVRFRTVSPGFFDALGLRAVAGRLFDERDGTDSQPVVVVNQAFARRYFSGEADVVGRRFRATYGANSFEDQPLLTIVGVTADHRSDGLTEAAHPMMFRPYPQEIYGGMWVLVKTVSQGGPSAEAIARAVRGLDAGVGLDEITTMQGIVAEEMRDVSSVAELLSVLAAIALLLSCGGLYGVLQYWVNRRSREIGIRMALGSDAAAVVRLILRNGMASVLAGIVIGAVVLVPAARSLQSLVYGVSVYQPVLWLGSAALLALAAASACLLPARSAARTNPAVSLRDE